MGMFLAQSGHKRETLMKARLILICALSGLCGHAFVQDIIHTIDGRSIEAKILEINDDDILYKTFDNQDGPDYRNAYGYKSSLSVGATGNGVGLALNF